MREIFRKIQFAFFPAKTLGKFAILKKNKRKTLTQDRENGTNGALRGKAEERGMRKKMVADRRADKAWLKCRLVTRDSSRVDKRKARHPRNLRRRARFLDFGSRDYSECWPWPRAKRPFLCLSLSRPWGKCSRAIFGCFRLIPGPGEFLLSRNALSKRENGTFLWPRFLEAFFPINQREFRFRLLFFAFADCCVIMRNFVNEIFKWM